MKEKEVNNLEAGRDYLLRVSLPKVEVRKGWGRGGGEKSLVASSVRKSINSYDYAAF